MSRVKVIASAIMLVGGLAVTVCSQTATDLDETARARIEHARASIVRVIAQTEPAGPGTQAVGFFVRNDLVATEIPDLRTSALVQVTTSTTTRAYKVLSWGNYFLPYVLVEKQTEDLSVQLGDSEHVAVNDRVYMLDDSGAILAGTVSGITTINRDPAFLVTLPTSQNKGAPIFNRNGEVIAIATTNSEGQNSGIALSSSALATLKHLGEPGVGAGRGDGPQFQTNPSVPNTSSSSTSGADTRPVRISGPLPRYTDEARKNKTEGTVLLRVLVGVAGEVREVRVVRGLPDGLNERAIEAAREAKFKPAMKDGKPVPFWISLEMSFNIR